MINVEDLKHSLEEQYDPAVVLWRVNDHDPEVQLHIFMMIKQQVIRLDFGFNPNIEEASIDHWMDIIAGIIEGEKNEVRKMVAQLEKDPEASARGRETFENAKKGIWPKVLGG